jgi:non-canonical (house-cleaning) NTP pyrophosphatase
MEEQIKNVIVGSMNRNKVNGVREVLEPLGYQVYGKEVSSNDSNQPKSDAETITGAVNRAYNLKEGFLRIGLEAGVHYESGVMYLVNWGALVDEEENVFIAGGTRIPLPKEIENLINSGLELKDAMDVYFDEHGINEREGAIGYFTNNYLPRMEIFTHITKLLYGQYTYFKKRGVK